MTGQEADLPTETNQLSDRGQLQKAVGDLWSSMVDLGEDYVVFMDRRRLNARVERSDSAHFAVSWEQEDGSWVAYDREFENPREAAFHAYQGPH
jgi:hypothetical protein